MRPKKIMPKMRLKKNYTRCSPFGTNVKLPILGCSKVRMTAGCGHQVETVVYVVDGDKESLLGLRDCRALGIIDIQPEGRVEDKVKCISYQKKKEQVKEGEVSGGQTQQEIDSSMEEITAKHPAVFKGLGRDKVEPIHIEVDPNIKPVKQKKRRIALHYREKFKDHLEEPKEAGVVSGPLGSDEAVGWVSNVVITHKSWTDKKIRVNLDTRPMADAVKTAQFPIPTPMELRHGFTGSDRYPQIDLNHAFHQFGLSDPTKDLF